ncbi:MAG: type II toxin-antitoxin system RelE/ParE family toxin [Synergistaceae bacterium]|nr:type II toxin-antitoxin system RelE/ParE family toxin [Synergistaceae bacterium]MBR1602415.1 type II toxin-antitoxin system RelE/ParE family toxin [Synergistaceae bacterium]
MPCWTVEYSEQAAQTLDKLDKIMRERIKKYLDELPDYPDPRNRGKALTGTLSGRWRYRVGDYRIICKFQNDKLIILVLEIGHRSKIYK